MSSCCLQLHYFNSDAHKQLQILVPQTFPLKHCQLSLLTVSSCTYINIQVHMSARVQCSTYMDVSSQQMLLSRFFWYFSSSYTYSHIYLHTYLLIWTPESKISLFPLESPKGMLCISFSLLASLLTLHYSHTAVHRYFCVCVCVWLFIRSFTFRSHSPCNSSTIPLSIRHGVQAFTHLHNNSCNSFGAQRCLT